MQNLKFTFAVAMLGTLLSADTSWAQEEDPPPPPPPSGGAECTGSVDDPAECGAPNQTGGGGCGCGGGSILINFSDQGDTYQYADDFDDDTVEDGQDNCPFAFNGDQVDADGDGRGDSCDNCRSIGNLNQIDSDGDRFGDLCDDDADNDLILNLEDNCPFVPNPGVGGLQADFDNDFLGNACDDDDDNDSCLDAVDNCPLGVSLNCLDLGAIVPNECFADEDADNIQDQLDLCPSIASAGGQHLDTDADQIGDECDFDRDNDGVDNTIDNCALVPNRDQLDEDKDFRGSACDPLLCYVITDEASCLDPAQPFAVHAGKPIITTTLDEPVRLDLFANRFGTAIRYTWTVEEGPSDGATINNPRGAVNFSDVIQYVYESGREPRFDARLPGRYTVKLIAELAFEDDEYPAQRTAESRVVIDVGGDPKSSCAQAGTSTTAAAGVMLGLLALVRRRRR